MYLTKVACGVPNDRALEAVFYTAAFEEKCGDDLYFCNRGYTRGGCLLR